MPPPPSVESGNLAQQPVQIRIGSSEANEKNRRHRKQSLKAASVVCVTIEQPFVSAIPQDNRARIVDVTVQLEDKRAALTIFLQDAVD